MLRNDYILDLVESFGKNMGKIIFEVKEDPDPIVIESLSNKDTLLIILRKMIFDKKFNEAENALFEFAETNSCDEILEIGKLFYTELSRKSDVELLQNNFSRSEIQQGLRDFRKHFN